MGVLVKSKIGWYSYSELILNPLPDHFIFPGLCIHIIDIEIGSNIKALMMDSKVKGARPILCAYNPVKNIAGPDQHSSSFKDDLISFHYFFW